MRGQASIELFLVVSLFAVLFIWLANYSEAFKESSGASADRAAARAGAVALASVAGASCVSGANTSLLLTCGPSFASITSNRRYGVNVSLARGFWWEPAACLVSANLAVDCRPDGSWVCAVPVSGVVSIVGGKCG